MSFKGKENAGSQLKGAEEGYNLHAKYYDEAENFLDSFERDELKILLREGKFKKCLILGCGTGRDVKLVKTISEKIVGVDLSEEMIKIAKKKFRDVEFIIANAEDLPLENESFDLVIATFLIVHLKNLDKTFREAYRVLKDKGVFIVTNVNQRKPPRVKGTEGSLIIQSYYHRPEDVIKSLDEAFFSQINQQFAYDNDTWINQIVKAIK